ncbi:MAG: phosphatase PAP2 family protein [Oscillospiraceae bacterium]|nr:phosphatase PAP2 family protein [Oscillospiraceae bacterium]
MLRQKLRKIIPVYAIFPLCMTAVTMLCSYQAAKVWQLLFGFHDPMDLSLVFDLKTPFLPGWVWAYVGSYFFWMYQYITVAREDPLAGCRLAVADGIGKMICLVFFLGMPTTNVRPEVEGSGLTILLMKAIYFLDTPTNLFPSIHCLVAWVGTRYIYECKKLKHKLPVCILCTIGTFLVFACTLLTKQHVVLDVLGGVLVGEIGWWVARLSPLPRIMERWNQRFQKTKVCSLL